MIRPRNARAGKPALDIDADPLNAAARAHADRTAAENRAELKGAHAAMLAFAAAVEPAHPRFAEMPRQMSVDTTRHDDEHAVEVRAWLLRTGR